MLTSNLSFAVPIGVLAAVIAAAAPRDGARPADSFAAHQTRMTSATKSATTTVTTTVITDVTTAVTTAVTTTVITGTVRDATSGVGLAGITLRASVALGSASTANASNAVGSVGTLLATALSGSNGTYRIVLHDVPRGAQVRIDAMRAGFVRAFAMVAPGRDSARIDLALVHDATAAETSVAQAVQTPATVSLGSVQAAVQPGSPPVRGSTKSATSVASPMLVRSSVGNVVASGGRREASGSVRDRRGGIGQTGASAPGMEREQYDRIEDNPFLGVALNPRSTFSIDVDRAAYGNVRRFLSQGQRPPADAVRIEELVNYFPYTLNAPRGDDPIAITTEVAPAPWQPRHALVRIALKARDIETGALPPSNLTFLIDVSGSMSSPDKLPLVKASLRLLVDQLREQDRVAIVVYAGSAGLVLPSTSGRDKARIAEAIDRLESGGSTAGGAGIELAYRVAAEHMLRAGNNRVILATDGDFNVGASSDAEMERLIEAKRASGVYLTVLGFGTGNLQDAKMEKLARKGNGNYAYVDDLAEARKTLVHEMGATLVTVANDVKLQVEFNPARVRGYRLIGYEDRLLRDEDFADDRKDAGDIGAGHSVTALYEVALMGGTDTTTIRGSEPLRYAAASAGTSRVGSPRADAHRYGAGELLFVSLRYKRPGESTSRLLSTAVSAAPPRRVASNDFRFAASVAAFGMLLRDSEYKGSATSGMVLELARDACGDDAGAYRAGFVTLVEQWRRLDAPARKADQ